MTHGHTRTADRVGITCQIEPVSSPFFTESGRVQQAFDDALASAGYDVIGVSPDKPEKLAKFREKEDLKVTLVGDPSKETLAAYGAFGEKKLYGKTVTGVIRSTVVVGEDGTVEHAFYNVKATGHVAKIMRDLGV